MKIKSLLAGMVVSAALASCTNQDIIENESEINTSTAKAYIGIKIADPANGISRATGDFENGDDIERTINNALFIFYTKGEYTTATEMGNITIDQVYEDNNSVEAVTTAVVVLNPKDQFPDQVVAFLNVTDEVETALKNQSLAQAMQYLGKRNVTDKAENISSFATENNFIMTNSVYLNANGIACATPVSPGNFAQTEEAALANPIKIYVERMAAKVAMEEKASGVKTEDQDITMSDNKKYTLELVIDGWGLNGLNKSSYLLKNVDEAWTGANWSWANDAPNYRSYWAKDANYDSGMYPQKSSEYAKDPDKYDLEYRSWNDINGDNKASTYCLENTFSNELYGEDINKTTHMIIVGHYILKDGDGQEVPNVKEIYKYATTFYIEENLIKHLASLFENTKGVYTKTTEGEKDIYTPVSTDKFILAQASRSDAKLYFNGDKGVTYYDKTKTAYTSVDQINEEILKALGSATAYRDNIKTIFTVPIQHLNYSEKAENEGRFGIVRNHVYKLTLNSIKNLGEGVYDPDEDIVITPEPKEYFVGATLNILSWKVVNQGVDL